MPPLAFCQLGETVVPTGGGLLFHVFALSESTKCHRVMLSFCERADQSQKALINVSVSTG